MWSQLIDQEKIHSQCLSEDSKERGKALNQLKYNFSLLSNKQQAWEDLIILINDKSRSLRYEALDALTSSYLHVPNKQQAWNDLYTVISEESCNAKFWVADILASLFPYVPDKQQAWNSLHRLISDENLIVRFKATNAYSSVFSYIPDKQQAWDDLIILTNDKDSDIRSTAAFSLGSAFFDLPEKRQAWNDFHKLTSDERWEVRSRAVEALGYAFSQIPDKQQAWDDLHRLTDDDNINVKQNVTVTLFTVFSYLPDKQQAWNDLIKLSKYDNVYGKLKAVKTTFSSVFPQVPEKQQAWNDLIKLIEDANVDIFVKHMAAASLGPAFIHVSDKKQACKDLHELTTTKNKSIRLEVVDALCLVFYHVQDKQQVWEDLIQMTRDKDVDIRTSSSYSLGKVSIFNASQAEKEEDYKKELEKAILFFEKASVGPNNPAQFCLPFYRSFYSIIFEKNSSKTEIDNYLSEAKYAIEGSRSKRLLLDAVENLSNALKEVQNLESLDFESMKYKLNFYRTYCDRAAELMTDIENVVPFATKAMRKGLPILDRNLKILLEEIQEKAKAVCKQTRGTSAESLGLETNKAAKELSEFNDYLTFDTALNKQIEHYRKYCRFIFLEKRSQFLEIIEETKNMGIHEKMEAIEKISNYVLDNALFPCIENIPISAKIKDNIRIATVQLDYKLSEEFPYKIEDEDKKSIKQKIENVLKIAQDEKVDILCLPELCTCEEWLSDIRKLCQKMIIIPGTYYDKENHNVCKLITDFDAEIPPQFKIIPSDFEMSDIIGQRMVSGEKVLNVYESHFGKFAVLICRDFGNFLSNLKGMVDIVLCPSYNEGNDRFHNIAHNHITDSPSYIIISNTAQYGGTSIFGRMKKSLFGTLEQNNCKIKGDTSYKLCQIEKGEEGMIVANFNLIYKSPPLQTPINPNEDIRPVEKIKKIIFKFPLQ